MRAGIHAEETPALFVEAEACARQDVDSRRDCGQLADKERTPRSIRRRSVGGPAEILDER